VTFYKSNIFYLLVLAVISASVILFITLDSNYSGGWDYVDELKTFDDYNSNGGWTAGLLVNSNLSSSLVVSLIVPHLISKGVSPYFLLQIIIPLLYSFSTMIFYLYYKHYMKNWVSFLLCLFVLYLMTPVEMFDIRIMLGVLAFSVFLISIRCNIILGVLSLWLLTVVYYNFAICCMPVVILSSLYYFKISKKKHYFAIGIVACIIAMAWLLYATDFALVRSLMFTLKGKGHWYIDTPNYLANHKVNIGQAVRFILEKVLPITLIVIGWFRTFRTDKPKMLFLVILSIYLFPLLSLWQIRLMELYSSYKIFFICITILLPFAIKAVKPTTLVNMEG